MPEPFIPSRPEDVSPSWLTMVLRGSGVLDHDRSITSIAIEDPGSESSHAGQVSRLALTYDRGSAHAPATIIAKFPAAELIIRYLFRSIYRAETRFYRELAGHVPISVPNCYAALTDRRESRSLLLLEDLGAFASPGDHERGCTDQEATLAVSRLGQLHARFWNSPELGEMDWLGTYGTGPKKNWLIYAAAWLPFQRRLRQVTPPATHWLMGNLWRYRSRLTALTAGRPLSLQHGDFRLANLAYSEDDVYVFDWQVIRIGPPLFDLAWFMLTSLSVEQRRTVETQVFGTYHAALIERGVRDYSWDDAVWDFRSGLLLAIPQIMVIGAFLRFDDQRKQTLALLLERFESLAEDYDLKGLLDNTG